MSTTGTQESSVASTPPSFRKWRWRLSLCGLLLGGLWLTSGRGGMGEFSPYTLESRWRYEYTILFGEIPVYRSRWRHYTNPLLEHLLAEGIVAPVDESTDHRWELVFHWNDAWRDGYGGLYRELQFPDLTIEWCKADPARTAYYYSELFKYLRSDWRYDHWTAYQMSYLRSPRGRDRSTDDLRRAIAQVRAGILYDQIWLLDHGDKQVPDAERARLEHAFVVSKLASGETD